VGTKPTLEVTATADSLRISASSTTAGQAAALANDAAERVVAHLVRERAALRADVTAWFESEKQAILEALDARAERIDATAQPPGWYGLSEQHALAAGEDQPLLNDFSAAISAAQQEVWDRLRMLRDLQAADGVTVAAIAELASPGALALTSSDIERNPAQAESLIAAELQRLVAEAEQDYASLTAELDRLPMTPATGGAFEPADAAASPAEIDVDFLTRTLPLFSSDLWSAPAATITRRADAVTPFWNRLGTHYLMVLIAAFMLGASLTLLWDRLRPSGQVEAEMFADPYWPARGPDAPAG
jgi:hypothetical protein